jgi:hypothetical protein
MSHDPHEFQTSIRQLLRRTALDQDFRRLALENSNAALEKLGITPPPGISVEFIDNFGKSRHTIVLPDPVVQIEELSDEDLDEVAGGCVLASTMT